MTLFTMLFKEYPFGKNDEYQDEIYNSMKKGGQKGYVEFFFNKHNGVKLFE